MFDSKNNAARNVVFEEFTSAIAAFRIEVTAAYAGSEDDGLSKNNLMPAPQMEAVLDALKMMPGIY